MLQRREGTSGFLLMKPRYDASMIYSDCCVASKVFIVLQGRALVGTYLIQQVSGDVTGRYIPPFYQLATITEVSNCY